MKSYAEFTAGALGGAAAGAAAAATATKTVLGVVGFTSAGIAKGSLAASGMSTLCGAVTPAGGFFATATSVAMGGAASALPVVGAGAAAGAAIGAAGYGVCKIVGKMI